MSEFLTTASNLQCPHGGTVSVTSSNTRAKAGGAFIVRSGDTFLVGGCPFTPGSAPPHPCVRVQWLTSALSNKAQGDASLTKESVGLCIAADGAPQGNVLVNATQACVKGR
jgi:hypothetical protein